DVDTETWTVSVHVSDARSPARRAIQELAVLANEVMAETLQSHGIPAIYRAQAAPNQPLPTREDIPDRTVWVNETRKRLPRTITGLTPGPHSTLGLPAYVQATSPIRRYQDLLHVRQLLAHLRGDPIPYDADAVTHALGATDVACQTARQCERETTHYWLLEFMRCNPGRVYEGKVIGHTRQGSPLVFLAEIGLRYPVRGRNHHVKAGDTMYLKAKRITPRRAELLLERCEAPSPEPEPSSEPVAS
ncbi:MAG: RNB domain-containing ribonuclease, partial [Planctomycetota bacterium]